MEQLTIFDELCDEFRIAKPIRLIELFAGYGSQSMALKRIGAKFDTTELLSLINTLSSPTTLFMVQTFQQSTLQQFMLQI